MKNLKQLLATSVLVVLSTASQAAIECSASVAANEAIPDGSSSGVASAINVSSFGNQIVPGSLSVTLNINGSYSGDLYAYLTHGSGFAVLLNRVGVSSASSLGYGDFGLNVKFSDSAANGNVHNYQQVTTPAAGSQLTGTWSPDGRNVSPYAVNGTEASTATLSSFSGIDPNGDWTLFVADVNGGDLHTLVSWGVDMAVVPEATGFGLSAGMVLAMIAIRQFCKRRFHAESRGDEI